MNNIVEIKNLCRDYGNVENISHVLKNISLVIKEKEFVSIMGPSGCGKSTLLYILGGLEKPTLGSVNVLGHKLEMEKDKTLSLMRAEELGFVFQFYNLVMNLSVEENILLPVIMAKKKVKDYLPELETLLKLLKLEEKRKTMPNLLSGGQQQRVAIARALIMKPKLILADEPTGNLDSQSGKDVMEYFKKINEEMGITIVMVTHSEAISQYAKRKIILKDGMIEQQI